MKVFQQKSKIQKFEYVQDFVAEYNICESDFILASKSIYDMYFAPLNLKAHVAFKSSYGSGEPTDIMMDELLNDFRKTDCTRIIAIGGGAVIDMAKILVLDGNYMTEEIFKRQVPLKKVRTLIAVPTTCGAGSEVSNVSITQLTAIQSKLGLAVDEIYADDAALNAVFGGISDIEKEVSEKKTVIKTMPNGAVEEQKIESTNVVKGFIECFDTRSAIAKPETDKGIAKIWKSIKGDFEVNFLKYDRWKTIFKGLWVTIKLTIFALIIGLFLGILIAFVRSTYLKTTKHGILLRFFNKIAQVYLTVIRGTPAVVQIMIIYFVIFMPLGVDKFISAVVCFGINSAAYVAEIVRGGIMSVDEGQSEAGRSLGFGYMQTMMYIVFPQAFKAVLPALANEFVVLLKETSVAFYIGLGDLMYAGNAIRSATYSPFMPLVAVALIYLVMVMFLTMLVGKLERRLKTDGK